MNPLGIQNFAVSVCVRACVRVNVSVCPRTRHALESYSPAVVSCVTFDML